MPEIDDFVAHVWLLQQRSTTSPDHASECGLCPIVVDRRFGMRLRRVTHGMYPAAGGGLSSIWARLMSPTRVLPRRMPPSGLPIWLSLALSRQETRPRMSCCHLDFGRVRSQALGYAPRERPLVQGVGSDGWEPRTAWGWADTRGFGLKKSCRMSHITPSAMCDIWSTKKM